MEVIHNRPIDRLVYRVVALSALAATYALLVNLGLLAAPGGAA